MMMEREKKKDFYEIQKKKLKKKLHTGKFIKEMEFSQLFTVGRDENHSATLFFPNYFFFFFRSFCHCYWGKKIINPLAWDVRIDTQTFTQKFSFLLFLIHSSTTFSFHSTNVWERKKRLWKINRSFFFFLFLPSPNKGFTLRFLDMQFHSRNVGCMIKIKKNLLMISEFSLSLLMGWKENKNL